MNSKSYKKGSACSISMTTVCITLWVALAFLSNIILNSFSGRLFMVLALFTAVLYILSMKIVFMQFKIFDLHFFACCMIILIGYILLPQPSTLIDIIMFVSGYVIIRYYVTNPVKYLTPMKLMIFFGFFFAVGVILNFSFPSLYNVCLNIFPAEFASAVKAMTFSTGGERIRGFTTNSGTSAGFIVIAILAGIARLEGGGRNKREKLPIIFMFVALLITGKRAHLLFLIITIALCYLLPVKGKEKMKRYWRIFLVTAVFCVVVVISWNYLIEIPFFARLEETFQGFLSGEDVTSARNSLSLWAIQLFKENPIIGIGWNAYRSTVVGHATLVAELDTHNIYLQLLCETGIVGFTIFVSFFAMLWVRSKNAYINCMQSNTDENFIWRVVLKFSFMLQTFFLLYGLTGNPLYDQSWQIIYMFSIAVCMGYRYRYVKM